MIMADAVNDPLNPEGSLRNADEDDDKLASCLDATVPPAPDIATLVSPLALQASRSGGIVSPTHNPYATGINGARRGSQSSQGELSISSTHEPYSLTMKNLCRFSTIPPQNDPQSSGSVSGFIRISVPHYSQDSSVDADATSYFANANMTEVCRVHRRTRRASAPDVSPGLERARSTESPSPGMESNNWGTPLAGPPPANVPGSFQTSFPQAWNPERRRSSVTSNSSEGGGGGGNGGFNGSNLVFMHRLSVVTRSMQDLPPPVVPIPDSPAQGSTVSSPHRSGASSPGNFVTSPSAPMTVASFAAAMETSGSSPFAAASASFPTAGGSAFAQSNPAAAAPPGGMLAQITGASSTVSDDSSAATYSLPDGSASGNSGNNGVAIDVEAVARGIAANAAASAGAAVASAAEPTHQSQHHQHHRRGAAPPQAATQRTSVGSNGHAALEPEIMCPPGAELDVFDATRNETFKVPSDCIVATDGALHLCEAHNRWLETGEPKPQFMRCKKYVEGTCAAGSRCTQIHTVVMPSPTIHLNLSRFTEQQRAMITAYETLPEGVRFFVYPSNSTATWQEIMSERILRTDGAQNAFFVLRSTQEQAKAAGDEAGLHINRTPLRPRHCAHFQSRRVCYLGSSCNFIHSLVPAVDTTKAPPPPPPPPPSHMANGRQGAAAGSADAGAHPPSGPPPPPSFAAFATQQQQQHRPHHHQQQQFSVDGSGAPQGQPHFAVPGAAVILGHPPAPIQYFGAPGVALAPQQQHQQQPPIVVSGVQGQGWGAAAFAGGPSRYTAPPPPPQVGAQSSGTSGGARDRHSHHHR